MLETDPPKFMLRFLKWFCDAELHPFIEGDLFELYQERVAVLGKRRADRRFIVDVLLLFRPGMIRRLEFLANTLYHLTMMRNHFKISIRSLSKQKLFTAVNVAGMTLGLTCFILIALYIRYESSFDKHHHEANQLYRISQLQVGNDIRGKNRYAFTPLTVAPAVREACPAVVAATTMEIHKALFVHNKQGLYEEGLYADEAFFDVFSLGEFDTQGKAILQDPNAVILTHSFANKYFGDESAVGKDLLLNGEQSLTVKAVIEDPPTNQHFQYDYITSYKNLPWYQYDIGFWNHNNYRTYIRLEPGTDPKSIEAQMEAFDKYTESAYRTFSFKPTYFLQSVPDIHLHSDINFEIKANGDIRYLYLSATIALIVLLLASINYMNLAASRSAGQALQVGIRKVLGARRSQIVQQFLVESILITLLSFTLAISLAYILIPVLNKILDVEVPFDLTNNPLLALGLLLTALVIAVLSGLYPAIVSSASKPIHALKGKWFNIRREGMLVRNSLVVGQFAIAIVLAICSVVVYQQLRFIQNTKVGYSRDQVVYLSYNQTNINPQTPAIRQELLRTPGIKNVSFANGLPLNLGCNTIINSWEGQSGEEELYIYCNYVDHNFLDLFEIEIVEGRNFSPAHPGDTTNHYLLNEAALKKLGWTSAVGKRFRDGKIIGVVKDFHYQPFDLAIEPLFMGYRNANRGKYIGHITMKIEGGEEGRLLADIEQTMKTFLPNQPFDPQFMDESYNQLYSAEQRFGDAFSIFTLIALFIACMGLFGLVSHRLVQRTKEIGIRKVLGATVVNIVSMVSKDFLQMVLLSTLIAIPVAWWGMHKWLEDFVYRTELNVGIFLLVGVLAIGLAFLTVSLKTVQAASANPMDNLRAE
ncbi:MAG: ABC transporter permease [Saprospiraceae bacterium]|nr:ABC transporter permease [Saprospiraceae bacterium]